MTRHTALTRTAVLAALGLATGLAGTLANADPRDEHFRAAPQPHQHLDARFSHNHAYFDRGYAVHDLPRDRIAINRGPNRYFYAGGSWYAPRGGVYVVVAPPVGVFIPALPPFYSTVWFGGVPYYYANDTYYMWSAQDNGYEVVDTPSGAVNAAPDEQAPQPPTTNQLFIYPRNNQSTEQQAKDKYDCHASAMGQTGFDPTAAGGNVSPDQFNARSTNYYRAMAACLQARGYSVE